MALQPPTATMKCAHCGELFKGNPRSQPLGSADYCSIACEEGRGPRPMSDPQSPDYHLYLKGDPEDLVGRTIVATGLKLVDYSPDWCKGPNEWAHGIVVDHDPSSTSYVKRYDVVLGTVVDYGYEGYTIECEETERVVHDFLMVEQLKTERWWAE